MFSQPYRTPPPPGRRRTDKNKISGEALSPWSTRLNMRTNFRSNQESSSVVAQRSPIAPKSPTINMRTNFRSKQESSRMNTEAPQRSPMEPKSPTINPNSVRETIQKVDKCMDRLQELQFTLTGGTNINPNSVRETIQKVDECMARLQELQFTVTGGTNISSGVTLSPRRSMGCMGTSLRSKPESSRMKTASPQRSPPPKFSRKSNDKWRQMSLPAMLTSDTLDEISKTSKLFATSSTSTQQKCFCRRRSPIIERPSNNSHKFIKNENMTLRDYLKSSQ